ncbi:HD domain-containing phosphohydrolase [Massilia putida]|uniref:HD domain-containing phosphohydrolase n=1 Tax=Massilia putida TaxID=1141883 RepID=UPI000A9150AF|nr:HD domain-containing phosphohydrolase [Massilia putida]
MNLDEVVVGEDGMAMEPAPDVPAAPAPALAGGVSAYLELLGSREARAQLFPLHDEVVIGRDRQDALASDQFVCIPLHTISRRHARLRRRGEAWSVEDLHSSNGTFVNDERLQPGSWHALVDGDELSLASTRFVFRSMVAQSAASMPTVIRKSVDATQYAPTADPRDASRGELEKSVLKLHAMAQVSIALGAVTDRATLTEKIMNFIFDLFPLAERAFILLRQNDRDPPVPVAARRRNGMVEDPRQARLSHTIVDEVLGNKRAILSVDTLADRHFAAQDSIVAQAIRSVMCAPLIVGDEVLGLIQVDSSSDPRAFHDADLELLTGVCAETAVALKNFQLYSDIERLLDGFVRASVQAIEERDPVTAGHSFRVASYAERLATALDRAADPQLRRIAFTREQLREIRYAALLHDFGKVGVREHVLRKEKKLHHADMRLLEQRFLYARACLERQAYHTLAQRHLDEGWSAATFRTEKEQADARLAEEAARLDGFLATIRSANEPAISRGSALPDLRDIVHYGCHDPDGQPLSLLEEHEVAALSIPKGCLTADERRQIEEHVVDSYSFLVLIPWTRDLAGVPAIAHGHHEKLDGSGYPSGLRGPQISIQTRILTICDIYDALTAGDRPYKKAVPVDLALDLMHEECDAGHIDARLFQVFVDARAWMSP